MGSITRQKPKRIAFESISKWNNCTCWWLGRSAFPVGDVVGVGIEFTCEIGLGETEVFAGELDTEGDSHAAIVGVGWGGLFIGSCSCFL